MVLSARQKRKPSEWRQLRVKSTRTQLLALLLAALLLRLFLLSFVHNPGLHDPVHYYNLGRRLAQGQGFTIDYIWHYSHLPEDVVHPIDHWMPLAGLAAAVGFSLGGLDPRNALIVFVVAGTLLPLLVFIWSRQLRLSEESAMIAALFAAFLPDMVWNSLRTDTTILCAVFACGAVMLLLRGLRRDDRFALVLSGVLAGLAYLTRNDAVLALPVIIAVMALWQRVERAEMALKRAALATVFFAAAFLLTIAPWLIRNLLALGALGTAETSRMFFMVEHHDHYAYGVPITLESMFQRQSLSALLGKRLFELAAAFKQIAVSFTLPLVLFAAAGLAWIIRRRDREIWLSAAPAFIWLSALLLAYPILLPLKSQAGSFEKAFLSIAPLLLPLAPLGIDLALRRALHKRMLVGVLALWLIYSSYSFVRQETAIADQYYKSIAVLIEAVDALPDRTGDQRLRLMAQDPYVMSYFGYESIMVPLASREDTLELAQRYGIDYLMMPPGRPALDPLYLGREKDARFELAAHLADAGKKPFELYQFAHS